ncbi:hypothetical protein R0G64_32130, partial [Pseudomonas otitidis]
ETSVALDLTNLSGQPQALDVKLEAEGLLRLAEAPAGQGQAVDRDADAALAEATEGAHRHPQGGALAVGQL